MKPMNPLKKILKTYLPFTKAGIQGATTYRVNFIAWFIGDIMICFVMYYVWRAVFLSSGSDTFNGFTMTDMAVFLFVSNLTGYLTGSDGSFSVGEEIRDGNIAMRLIKPVDFDMTFLFSELGQKSLTFTLIFAPMLLGVEIYKYFAFGQVMFDVGTFALYMLSTAMSYLFSFYMNVCFGFMAFFLKNLWGFNILKDSMLRFVSGSLIPLAFMPGTLRTVLEWLPFASLSYTPVMIYMGKYAGTQVLMRLGLQFVWVVSFYLFSKLIFSIAMRHVTVQGG